MRLFKILFLVLLLAGATSVSAQKNNTRRTTVKFKPPKLTTSLSTYKDSVFINAGEAEHIIDMPLLIRDSKNNAYTITSYQFMYKKNVVTEDEESGKASAATALYSDRFKSSPLTEPWINKVREQLTSGELLYFFDIIVKDAQGRVMYAPDLKIIIQ